MKQLVLIILISLLTSLPARSSEIVITAVGDIMLAGRYSAGLSSAGFQTAFSAARTELERGNILLGNLEAPISDKGTEFSAKKFRFRMDPSVTEAIKTAGFNSLTLANNHIMDFGAEALNDTISTLDREGIAWFGAGPDATNARRFRVIESGGKKVAFLGYSLTLPEEFWAARGKPGTSLLREDAARKDIADARKAADLVIVSVHWGEEGTARLREYQPRLGKMMIDAGADVVIGHHPHVVQGIERYRHGIICYSLGNFAFATPSRKSSGALVHLKIAEDTRELEIVPLDLFSGRHLVQPRIATGNDAAQKLKHISSLSEEKGTRVEIRGERGFVRF